VNRTRDFSNRGIGVFCGGFLMSSGHNAFSC
jgi:hypothetical protein